MTTITAVLLSGGKSSRMGKDKNLLEWEGEPLWQRQLRTLQELSCEAMGISAVTPPRWWAKEPELFLDDQPHLGPLGALATILRRIETSHALILAVDMPRMTPAFLKGLIAQADPGMAVVPERDGWYEGLAAVYPRESLTLIPPDPACPDRSMQRLVAEMVHHRMVWIRKTSPTEARLFDNWNEPWDSGV